MGIKQVLSAPRSPWQRAYIERLIGTIRRECLDHIIVFNEGSLRFQMQNFCDYYHRSRTHLGLQKDTPETRAQSNHRKLAASSPFQKLVVCIIATNVAPPDGRVKDVRPRRPQ
jgi:transposase InsO family protein